MSPDWFWEVLTCVMWWLESVCMCVCVGGKMSTNERLCCCCCCCFLWPCWEGRPVLWPLRHHCHFMYCVYFKYFLIKENKSVCDSDGCVCVITELVCVFTSLKTDEFSIGRTGNLCVILTLVGFSKIVNVSVRRVSLRSARQCQRSHVYLVSRWLPVRWHDSTNTTRHAASS